MTSEWDTAASTFDDEPDHGLRDPRLRAAWSTLLLQLLPAAPASVLDAGCGTGSLSVLLAELSYTVTGIDSSSAMLARAAAKAAAAKVMVDFRGLDAADPTSLAQSFDVVLSRHVLWALPDPAQVLRRWLSLLAPTGRLVLIEGFWHTGVGMPAETLKAALPSGLKLMAELNLSAQPELWGSPVTDERYALVVSSPLPT